MPDDRVITVKHPSSMVLRRKRKRSREHWLVATHTSVVLRSGSPEDLGEVHTIRTEDGDLTWRVFEGALWYQVSGVQLARYMDRPWDRFGVSEFVAYLAGEPFRETPAYTDLGQVIRRTPLAAVSHNARDANRGASLSEDNRLIVGVEVAEIFGDDRVASAEDLRRFMHERVCVVGDLVLIRAYEPLVKLGLKGLEFQPFPQMRETSYRLARHREPLGYRPDSFGEGLAWEGGKQWSGHPAGLGSWAGSLADAPFDSDTARLLAGFAVTAALGALYEIEDAYGYFLSDPVNASSVELMSGYGDEVWKWADKASMGRIGVDEAQGAIAAARRLTDVVADCYGKYAAGNHMVREAQFLVRRFEEFEWPRVRLAAVPDADVDALTNLTM